MAIRNPIEWAVNQFRVVGHSAGAKGHDQPQAQEDGAVQPPKVRPIGVADLRDVLARGFEDFGDNRTDVVFLCIFYPVIGLVLGRMASGYDMLPLLFPLASGFALVGPFAAVGLYEISRRREQGFKTGWADAFGVLHSPALGRLILLGAALVVIFLLWLAVAAGIYLVTLGPAPPASIGSFVRDVFTTGPGWVLIIAGVGVGFLFALLVLMISVVSFPLLLDRDVGIETAVRTSISAVVANPGPMAIWGLIVAGGLVIGSIPLLLGLVIVLPVLGHSTWHLYRAVVSR